MLAPARALTPIGWNVLIDTVLAVLPATIFYKLKLSWQKKLGLCVLLGLGVTAAACAAVKTTFLAALTARSDLTCAYPSPGHTPCLR